MSHEVCVCVCVCACVCMHVLCAYVNASVHPSVRACVCVCVFKAPVVCSI